MGNPFDCCLQKEVIAWAWELLTEVYKMPKDRLYVTYFGGDKDRNLEPDLEARDLWLSHGLVLKSIWIHLKDGH